MEILLVNIGIVAGLVLIYVTGVFVLAQLKNDNGIMDIAYGPAFLCASYGAIVLTNSYRMLPALLVTAIALWSMRLSLRIFFKNLGKPEDARYAAWRAEWRARSVVYFLLRSYAQINLLQGAVIVALLLPFGIALSNPQTLSPLFVSIGAVVFLCGLTYETIADWQIDRFVARKKAGTETAELLTNGLFKYSRRPNYFGETLIWWGMAIAVLPLPFGWLGLVSPLLITHVVRNVTGPMLEKIFLEKYPTTYQAYREKTNYLVPDFHSLIKDLIKNSNRIIKKLNASV